MKKNTNSVVKIESVSSLHSFMKLPQTQNPMITIIDHSQTKDYEGDSSVTLAIGLYNISIKKSFNGQLRYGRNIYDYNSGTMSFIAPNQIISIDDADDRNNDGWSLLFDAELLRNYPLGKAIKQYGFFSYANNEALHLSPQEEQIVEALVQNIQSEIDSRLDHFSQDVIVSNLELLLNYCNRFYARQFLTRKMVKNDLLIHFESVLDDYYNSSEDAQLPTVEKIAGKLRVSPAYLSDMLKSTTGMTAQQHIHEKLIDIAKELLVSTRLTVSEVAYQLGFEYPQSFSKVFKNKTNMTPLAYRKGFN